MGRRRPIDRVNWRLYRRSWLLPALALVVVLATSFAPDRTPDSPLPPSFTNEEAAGLIAEADRFSDRFGDRRPGSPGAIDAAQWIRDELRDEGFRATTVPATTTHPRSGRPVGIANVEAVLPGRTRDTVVVLAHRDNLGRDADGSGDPVGTVSLLQLAKDLAATRDRRRTFMLVSTDAATLNGAGARALAERLHRRAAPVVAVIALDRPGSGGRNPWVPLAPAGRHVPPLGLAQAARDAVLAEGGDAGQPSVLAQMLRLSMPVTLFEHGPLVARGLPAVTIAGGDERDGARQARPSATDLGDSVRSVQRVLGTLDAVDALQSAGKTYVSSPRRVYRGWALKIFVASLLLPVWLVANELLLRHRRSWNVAAAVGTVARAAMAGLFALVALWTCAALGLLPGGEDRPPMPAAIDVVPVLGLGVWMVFAGAGWLLARGPDWRRPHAAGRDVADIAVALLAGCVLASAVLATSPYTVLLLAPALHAWLVLASRLAYSAPATLAVWAAGLAAPIAAVAAVGASTGTGAGALPYTAELVASRSIPAATTMPVSALCGIGLLVLVAAFGRVGAPALPGVRRVLRSDPRAVWQLLPRPSRPALRQATTRRARPVRPVRRRRPGRLDESTPQSRAAARLRERSGQTGLNSR